MTTLLKNVTVIPMTRKEYFFKGDILIRMFGKIEEHLIFPIGQPQIISLENGLMSNLVYG